MNALKLFFAIAAAAVAMPASRCHAELMLTFLPEGVNTGAGEYDFDLQVTNGMADATVINSFNLVFDLETGFEFVEFTTASGEGSFDLEGPLPISPFYDFGLSGVNLNDGGLALSVGETKTLLSLTLNYVGDSEGDLLAATFLTTGLGGMFSEIVVDQIELQGDDDLLSPNEGGLKLPTGVVPEPASLLISGVLFALAGLRRPKRSKSQL